MDPIILLIIVGALILFCLGFYCGVLFVYYGSIKPAMQSRIFEWEGEYYQLVKKRR